MAGGGDADAGGSRLVAAEVLASGKVTATWGNDGGSGVESGRCEIWMENCVVYIYIHIFLTIYRYIFIYYRYDIYIYR